MSGFDDRIEREMAASIEQAKLINETLLKVYEALRRYDPTKNAAEAREEDDNAETRNS